jgi:GntR family transcriptional regulator of arabinose operon
VKKTSSQRLLQELKEKIASRVYSPGCALPSENQLCDLYGLSRPTVRRVLAQLCDDGLLEKRAGVGTFVRDNSESQVEQPLFRLGVDNTFSDARYYKRIWEGLIHSPYGRNIYFHFLDKAALYKNLPGEAVDGIMLCGFNGDRSDLASLQALGKPLILVNRIVDHARDVAYVTVDHRREMARGVEYLLRYGHRKIAMLCSDHFSPAIRLRCLGWEDAYRAMGLEVPENLKLSMATLTQPENAEQLRRFFEQEEFTAVACANAFIYERFCNEYIRWGGDRISSKQIVVFDDLSSFSDECSQNSSFIQMPLERFGAIAAEYLRKRQENPQLEPIRQFLPCNLVIREKLPPRHSS